MQRFPCTRFVPVCKQIINLLEKFIESPYVLCVFLEFCDGKPSLIHLAADLPLAYPVP